MTETRIVVPFPPSSNHYWRRVTIKGRQRVLISKRGREYRTQVYGYCLQRKPRKKLHGTLACTLDLYPPTAAVRDSDNFSKALLDALTYGGVYEDDSQIKDKRTRMFPKVPPGIAVITLWNIEPLELPEVLPRL